MNGLSWKNRIVMFWWKCCLLLCLTWQVLLAVRLHWAVTITYDLDFSVCLNMGRKYLISTYVGLKYFLRSRLFVDVITLIFCITSNDPHAWLLLLELLFSSRAQLSSLPCVSLMSPKCFFFNILANYFVFPQLILWCCSVFLCVLLWCMFLTSILGLC